jgi:hypothetical protein
MRTGIVDFPVFPENLTDAENEEGQIDSDSDLTNLKIQKKSAKTPKFQPI